MGFFSSDLEEVRMRSRLNFVWEQNFTSIKTLVYLEAVWRIYKAIKIERNCDKVSLRRQLETLIEASLNEICQKIDVQIWFDLGFVENFESRHSGWNGWFMDKIS